MSENDLTDPALRQCLELALEDPPCALLRLWLHCGDQRADTDFERRSCEKQAAATAEALLRDRVVVPIFAHAALSAVDVYLQEKAFLWHERRARRIRAQPDQGGGEYYVLPRREDWHSRVSDRQAGTRLYWMRRHQIVPAELDGIKIRVRPMPSHLSAALSEPPLALAAGGFTDGVRPNWNDSSPYQCSRLLDADKRWSSVDGLLAEVIQRGVAVLVLPELTVDADVRRRMCEWLRRNAGRHPLQLVVAGSFHELHPVGGQSAPVRLNVATLLDGWGGELLRHIKLRPQKTTKRGRDADEGIGAGAELVLLDAPFGLVATAICFDFCDTSERRMRNLWHDVAPALVLVPSMGEMQTNSAHRRRALELSQHYATATFVASQHPEHPEAWGIGFRPSRKLARGRPVLWDSWDWTEG